jgi:hypothetical protein
VLPVPIEERLLNPAKLRKRITHGLDYMRLLGLRYLSVSGAYAGAIPPDLA